MVTGIERLSRAAESLGQNDEPIAAAVLIEAASEVWSAMVHLSGWPMELRLKAVELQASLFRDGSLTIETSFDAKRSRLRQELRNFCRLAEQWDHASPAVGA